MIKNNESIVTITTRNIKYYKKLNYVCEVGDLISIDIKSLSYMSHNKVIAICELCQDEKEINFSKYNQNKKRQGYYSCRKCSNKKRKNTVFCKYGVEYISQTDSVRTINKVWMSSDEFRDKSVKKQIDKYGCLYVQTEENRNFISNLHKDRINILKNNGEYQCALSLESNTELKKNGMYNKYGHTYSFHIIEVKDKIQNTNITKFGHISPLGNIDIQNKSKDTIREKYGVDNVFSSKDIKEKIKNKIREIYGVDNPMQDKYIFEKASKSSFKKCIYDGTNISYQGTYELDFIKKYIDKLSIENGPSIRYIIDGVEKIYHSDFYIPSHNLICEVKSSYTYKCEEQLNIIKKEFSKKAGYNFIFIIDKKYDEFNKFINANKV